MDIEQTFVSVPWRPSAESLAPVRLFSVSPFAPVAQRSEAESEHLSSVRDSPHPEEDEKKGLRLSHMTWQHSVFYIKTKTGF